MSFFIAAAAAITAIAAAIAANFAASLPAPAAAPALLALPARLIRAIAALSLLAPARALILQLSRILNTIKPFNLKALLS